MVPKALDGWKGQEDKRVEDLGNEVRSLRMLLQNRLSGGSGIGAGTQIPTVGGQSYSGYKGGLGAGEQDRGNAASGTSSSNVGGFAAGGTADTQDGVTVASAPILNTPKKEASTSRGFGGGKAAIPAWQMPVKSKSGEGGGSEAGAGT